MEIFGEELEKKKQSETKNNSNNNKKKTPWDKKREADTLLQVASQCSQLLAVSHHFTSSRWEEIAMCPTAHSFN